ICYRLGIESETTTHILTCKYNSCSLEQIISKVLRRLADTKEIILKNQDNFIYRFTHIHITKGLPLGFITQETLIPTDNTTLQLKWTPKLHHDIITEINDNIWIPSRTYIHSGLLEYDTLTPMQTKRNNNKIKKKIKKKKIFNNKKKKKKKK